MSDYKWELRKGSRKDICPACGHRRFVPYVSSADHKTPAGAEFGRCDREQNCGYIRYPDTDAPQGVPAAAVPAQEPLRFKPEAIDVQPSALFDYAVTLLGMQDALLAWTMYRIGAIGNRTIFWQIDERNQIRAGKAIHYKTDGHRDKTAVPPVQWCHKIPAFDGLRSGTELQQCFFGQHLLADSNKPVAVVESEKTATIMSRIFPQYTWLACGGSQMLKSESRHKCLIDRKVILIPDHGQFFNWKRTAEKYNYSVIDYCEIHPIFDGCDILDYCDAANKKYNAKTERI